jgi:hypothetical protein
MTPKAAALPALPPIQGPLVDHLMQHAEHVSARAEVSAPARGHLPDILNLTAKLTLGMLILCMYVPLIRDVLG